MLKKSFVVYCMIGMFTASTQANLASLYPSGWHMVEDIFITQPQEEVSSIPHKIARIPACLMSLWGSFAISTVLLRKAGLSEREQAHNSVLPFKYLVSGAATYITYKALYNFTISHKECSALDRVITQWPHYRKHAPHIMLETFDELYANSKKGMTITNEQATSLVRLLKHGVYKQFPDRYDQKIPRSFDINKFFDFKKFEADVKVEAGNFLRGAADLYRAVTGR